MGVCGADDIRKLPALEDGMLQEPPSGAPARPAGGGAKDPKDVARGKAPARPAGGGAAKDPDRDVGIGEAPPDTGILIEPNLGAPPTGTLTEPLLTG
jgi:hypothetical protein